MTDKITMEGKYTTRDGCEVVVHTVSAPGRRPVVASINFGEYWKAIQYTADGEHFSDCCSSPHDLIPAKVKVKRQGWVNVYSRPKMASGVYDTEKDALRSRHSHAVDTVRIEWEQ